jgi:hypothetical protein
VHVPLKLVHGDGHVFRPVLLKSNRMIKEFKSSNPQSRAFSSAAGPKKGGSKKKIFASQPVFTAKLSRSQLLVPVKTRKRYGGVCVFAIHL